MTHKIRNKTLAAARDPLFRMRVERDRTKYTRKGRKPKDELR